MTGAISLDNIEIITENNMTKPPIRITVLMAFIIDLDRISPRLERRIAPEALAPLVKGGMPAGQGGFVPSATFPPPENDPGR